MKFYREIESGDYLCVDPDTFHDYVLIGQAGVMEGRATCIEGQRSSVCTTGIAGEYLRRACRRVARRDVPPEWLEALVGSPEGEA